MKFIGYLPKLLLISLLLFAVNPIFSQNPNLHIYLCFGQSNMSGQGPLIAGDDSVDPRFKVLRAGNHSGQQVGEFYPGVPPLGHSASQLGPADFFGRKMIELVPENVTVAVANIAIGGQSIDLFNKATSANYISQARNANEWWIQYLDEYGGDPYQRIIEMGQVAKQEGVIKGILFHQGENDSHQSYWPQRVKETYESILKDLDLDQNEVPFLIGELGHSDNGGTLGSRNPGITSTANSITNAHVIPSSGCEMLVEESYTLHFTRAGYKVLGERYAQTMYNLLPDLGLPSVTITSPSNGTGFTLGSDVTITAAATDSDGSVSSVSFYNGNTLLSTDNTAPYTHTISNMQAGSYEIRAEATDNENNKGSSSIIKIGVQSPYGGSAHVIPGRVQFEEYDLGGNGLAYYDDSDGSSTDNAFRNDEDVDIEDCTDAGGGYNLGYTTSGEWLEYTVDVQSFGLYDIKLRVACNEDGRTLSLTMNDVDITTNTAVPNTAGWQEWQTVTVSDVLLQEGEQVLRVTIGAEDYINMNYVDFELTQEISQEPYSGTAAIIPGKIEAEEYDLGGEGLGYHEANANGNEGGATFRDDEVDIEESISASGGYNIGYALEGEWLEYTVDVQNDGMFDLDLLVAKDGDGGIFHIEIDGIDVTGTINIPNTGGWQVYQTVTIADLNLTEGEHILKVVFDSQYINFDYMEFKGVITNTASLTVEGISVFPNPFTVAGISVKGALGASYVVYDCTSRKVEQGVVDNSTMVCRACGTGVYTLIIQTTQGVKTIKIMR